VCPSFAEAKSGLIRNNFKKLILVVYLFDFKMVLKSNSVFTRQKLSHFDGHDFQITFRPDIKNTREVAPFRSAFADVFEIKIKFFDL